MKEGPEMAQRSRKREGVPIVGKKKRISNLHSEISRLDEEKRKIQSELFINNYGS